MLRKAMTNNIAEIMAVIKALQIAEELKLSPILVRTDSQWLVDYFRIQRSKRLKALIQNNKKIYRMDPLVLIHLEKAAEKIKELCLC